MKTKTKYPSWFQHFSKPHDCSHAYRAVEFIEEKKVIQELCGEVETDEEFEGHKVFIGAELDYDDCYYESDSPSIKFEKFIKIKKPNPYYEKALKKFEQEEEKYKTRKKEWLKWKKIWDEEQKIIKEQSEKELLEKLKQKYEQNNRDDQTPNN